MKNIFLILLAVIFLTSCNGNPDPEVAENKKESLGENLKNAITSGKAVRCTYLDGEVEVETLVKGGKMRVNGLNFGQESGGMINDGEWVYIWNDGNKVGTKYNIKEIEALNGEGEGSNMPSDIENPEDWATEIEDKFETECKTANIADSEFVPPADITFQDMGDALKEANEFKERFEGQTEFNKEDMDEMEEMMKKMEGVYGDEDSE